MRVTVLGCGPAGLAASKAALDLGHEVRIISKAWQPSVLHGCQYLHEPIPGYEDATKTRVTYNLEGTAEQYRHKVYGDNWRGKVSPEDFIGEHDAWDIRQTYSRMWDDLIEDGRIQNKTVLSVRNGDLNIVRSLGADKIISTIPATNLCMGAHLFHGHDIYAAGYAGAEATMDDYVMCNGTDATAWYRVSNVFNNMTVEWPEKGFHLQGAVLVTKPLYTNCNCHADVLRVGRYGEWNKSVLVHNVYAKVAEALK